jgi:undecaprenyl-diphosphatase
MAISIRPSRSAVVVTAGVGVLAVVVLGATIYALGNGPLAIDSWWHDLMLAWRTPAGLFFAQAFQFVGGALSMTVLTIAVVVGFAIARRPWDALAVVVAMVVAEVATSALKLTFARPRPVDSLSTHAMTSFPSGHTSLAATLVVVLALLIRSRLVWILAVAWIIGMAWSRTYLEAHWLTDVIGGAVLGASVAVVTWATVDALHRAVERSNEVVALGAQR